MLSFDEMNAFRQSNPWDPFNSGIPTPNPGCAIRRAYKMAQASTQDQSSLKIASAYPRPKQGCRHDKAEPEASF
jgi:hypothetical protein